MSEVVKSQRHISLPIQVIYSSEVLHIAIIVTYNVVHTYVNPLTVANLNFCTENKLSLCTDSSLMSLESLHFHAISKTNDTFINAIFAQEDHIC